MDVLRRKSLMMVVMWAAETVVRPEPVVEATTPATRWRIRPAARRRVSLPEIRPKPRTKPRTAGTEPWPSRAESWTSRTESWTTPAWAYHRRWPTRSSRTPWSAWSLEGINLYYYNKYYISVLKFQKCFRKYFHSDVQYIVQKWLYLKKIVFLQNSLKLFKLIK